MDRSFCLSAVLLALTLCACGDPREDMVGGYYVKGTMTMTSGGSTQTDFVKDYVKVTSDTSTSGKLSVYLSGFDCTASATMTDSLKFKFGRTDCPPDTEDQCTYTAVLESGTGSKVEDYSELDLAVSGTISARCTDGGTGKGTFTISVSGFRSNNSGT